MRRMIRSMPMIGLAALPVIATLPVVAVEGLSEADLKRYGKQLSQECITCHRLDGKDVGVPSIVDMSKADFIKSLQLYRTGLRDNPTMVSVASTLDDQQIEALALYFSSLNEKP